MPKQPTIINLQGLRFVAAFLVLIGHVQAEAARMVPGFTQWNPIPWAVGVDVFFAISGFVMVLTAAEKSSTPAAAREFLTRRWLRIAPIYWLFTTLAVVMAIVLHNSPSWREAVSSYLFLPWSDGPFETRPVPVLSVGWTLNHEMAFYVLFAGSMLLPKRWSLVALCGVLVALAAAHPLAPKTIPPLFTWTNPIILEFVGGIGIGVAYLRGIRLPMIVSLGLCALGLFILTFDREGWGGDFRFFFWGIPSFMAAAGIALSHDIKAGTPWASALKLGGDASYVLYLSHVFTLNAVSMLWKHLPFHHNALAYVVVAIVACVPVGILAHLFIEKPLTRLLRNGIGAGARSRRLAAT